MNASSNTVIVLSLAPRYITYSTSLVEVLPADVDNVNVVVV